MLHYYKLCNLSLQGADSYWAVSTGAVFGVNPRHRIEYPILSVKGWECSQGDWIKGEERKKGKCI